MQNAFWGWLRRPAPQAEGMGSSHKTDFAVVLGTVTLVQALLSLAVLATASIGPIITQAYGIGPEIIGYQISAIYFAASVGSVGAGLIVRRYGPATTSIFALLLAAVGLIGLASGVLVIAAIAALCIGIGYSLTNPSAGQILERHCPSGRRNLVFSLKQTSVPIGGTIAGLALPLIAEVAGWRIAILSAAGLCLFACALVAPFRAQWDADKNRSVRFKTGIFEGLREVRINPGLRALATTSFCFSAMQLSLMSYVVSTLVIDFHWTLVAAGAMAAGVQVCGAVGRVIWGWLADRTRSPMAVLGAIGVITTSAAVSMQILIPDSTPLAVAVILVPFGFASIGWNGILLADIARHVPLVKVSSSTGAVMALTFAGVVVGPAILALVHGFTDSFAQAFMWLALFPLIGTITAFWAHLRSRRPQGF
jgi:MFS family permease